MVRVWQVLIVPRSRPPLPTKLPGRRASTHAGVSKKGLQAAAKATALRAGGPGMPQLCRSPSQASVSTTTSIVSSGSSSSSQSIVPPSPTDSMKVLSRGSSPTQDGVLDEMHALCT